MASIGGLFPTNQNSPASGSGASGSSPSGSSPSVSAADPTQGLGNQAAFLQLLVAQLKNQDPTQPQDGTQFVSQLAQFSNLEQNIGMKKDLDSINSKYTGAAAATQTQPSGTAGA